MKGGQRDADGSVSSFDARDDSGDVGESLEDAGVIFDSVAGQDIAEQEIQPERPVDGGCYDIAYEGGGLAGDAVESPARQKVTFRVTNGASTVRYLGVAAAALWGGNACSPYAISRGTANLVLVIPYQCGCECPAPPEPGLTELWTLSPGQTKDLVWDARALATYSTSMTCSAGYGGGPQPPSATVLHGVWQPVDPGNYQVTLIVKSSVPTTCQVNNDMVSCDSWSEDTYGRWQGGLCDRTTIVNATFVLPEAGDVIVPVAL